MKIEIGPYSDKERKVDIHIDNYDTWSMDHTLSLIIVPMLIQLRDTNHGYPNGISEEEWIDLQNKMIWSFEQIRDEKQWDKPISEWDAHHKKVQEGLDLFGKWYLHLWD